MVKTQKLLLASKSPQRKALLESLGLDFQVVLPDYEERDVPGLSPAELVERHSRGKAASVLTQLSPLARGSLVLGVDTMVVIDECAIGKAANIEEARTLLVRLSGRMQRVYSGVTLMESGAGPAQTSHAVTEVEFAAILPAELELYLAGGEWRGRAGAYAIQGRASAFVERINGDYTNVVGLPVPLLVQMLRRRGWWPPPAWGVAVPDRLFLPER